MGKRRSRYPVEVRPFMYCERCATLHSRLTIREERRPGDSYSGPESVWMCSAGHVLVRLPVPSDEGSGRAEPGTEPDRQGS